jgi:hypothetical protein
VIDFGPVASIVAAPPSAPAPQDSSHAVVIDVDPATPPKPTGSVRERAPIESDVKAERALLDRARAAFARGEAMGALALLDAHTHGFPAGRLTEEREALAVKALVAAERFEDARLRGARFRARFPASLLLPTVDNALGTIP